MKTVYLASPYSFGDTVENVRESIFVAEEVYNYGYLPFSPLLFHFWHFLIPHGYEFWQQMDLEWLAKCDILLRFGGESNGADAEVEFALEHNIPVYYSLEELQKEEF